MLCDVGFIGGIPQLDIGIEGVNAGRDADGVFDCNVAA